MQRLIKFRAWQPFYSLHREPGMYEVQDMVWYEKDAEGHTGEVFLARPGDEAESSEYIEDIVLMQYTGLTDRNGVEIYEGDVVNMHYFYEAGGMNGTYESETEIKGTIAYRPDFAVFVVADEERDYPITEYCQEPTEELEVIGNIYENPELLNEK